MIGADATRARCYDDQSSAYRFCNRVELPLSKDESVDTGKGWLQKVALAGMNLSPMQNSLPSLSTALYSVSHASRTSNLGPLASNPSGCRGVHAMPLTDVGSCLSRLFGYAIEDVVL